MKVFGLYGKSGTGKSHKSSEIVARYDISAVIDDGILVVDKRRVAGRSAKNENTLVAATKRATFYSDSHRNEVLRYLRNHELDSLLIIGTSKRMILKIAERLQLGTDIDWIPIEQFQTTKELTLAAARRQKNYHVIPIYLDDVQTTFFGKWFRKLIIRLGKRQDSVVVVKPVYTGRDLVIISPQCVKDIVRINADPRISIHKLKVEFEVVKLVVSTGQGITTDSLSTWRNEVIERIYEHLNVRYTIDIEWRSIQRHR